MVGLRWLTRKLEEVRTLVVVSVVEHQTKELRVNKVRGTEDGGQKADAIVSLVRQILSIFVPGLPAASC